MKIEHIALSILAVNLACAFFFSFVLGFIHRLLRDIERNTRPPKPDIKSFITKNTKGDQ